MNITNNTSFVGENISTNNERRHNSNLQISEAGRALWELGITNAYLHRLNQFARDNALIPTDVYRKMEVSIRRCHDKELARLRQEI